MLQTSEVTPMTVEAEAPAEAEALCDDIAMIRDGQIIARGTVPQIIDRFGGPRLEDAYLAAMGAAAGAP